MIADRWFLFFCFRMLPCIIISLILSLAGRVEGEVTKTVRAQGLGLIVGDDLSGGFEQAKKAAMRQAVEEAVGSLITTQTRVQNFAVIEDDILSQTEGYIRRFEVLEHGSVDSSTYQVTIEAVVILGDLHRRLDALELLIESAGNPYILCLGRERFADDGESQADGGGIVEGELTAVLQRASRRFNIAVPIEEEGLPAGAFDDLSRLAAWGQQQGCDVVIRGDATVQSATGIKIPFSSASLDATGLKSAAAELRVEALWTDTGQIFASLTAVGRSAASTRTEAYEKAIRSGMGKLADELLKQLAEDWREKVYSGRLIRLVVEGSREQLQIFERDFPISIGGIEKLYPRNYSGEEGMYDARSKNTGFQVARELTVKGLANFDVEIVQVSLNALKLQLHEQ